MLDNADNLNIFIFSYILRRYIFVLVTLQKMLKKQIKQPLVILHIYTLSFNSCKKYLKNKKKNKLMYIALRMYIMAVFYSKLYLVSNFCFYNQSLVKISRMSYNNVCVYVFVFCCKNNRQE